MANAKGLLRVTGTMDITQFWPDSESDADTVKVRVEKIEFSPDRVAHLPFATTHVFDNALVKGAQGPPKPPIKNGRLTIRLQGIDATELRRRAVWLAEICKQEGFRFSPRLHVDLYGNTRGT